MEFIIKCPHCLDYIIIEKINCGIFRHGVFISNGKQIDPHADKTMCDNYIKQNKIYGCGKPYQIIGEGDEYMVYICEYI
jgi:hypothetical protein